MVLLLGLLTAVSFGVADFLAGLTGRTMSSPALVLYSQSIGAGVIMAIAVLTGGRPDVAELTWGSAAGVVLGLGFILYYHALAGGNMGVIAAVTGVWTAAAPFIIGLWLGERPSLAALIGIALVVVSIALVSGGGRPEGRKPVQTTVGNARVAPGPLYRRGLPGCRDRGVFQASLAGVWLGLFFVFLDQPQSDSPLWTATAATAASALAVAAVVPALGQSLRISPRRLWIVAVVGLCQTIGTLFYVIATREGLLSVVAVAGALTPVPTAIMAFLILRERASMLQRMGILAALTGITLMMRG